AVTRTPLAARARRPVTSSDSNWGLSPVRCLCPTSGLDSATFHKVDEVDKVPAVRRIGMHASTALVQSASAPCGVP
ncbi:hypothetical protein, partial [Ralstonia sp. TCR112]|uniref:hypothetical protein n=1 Tax=Ralstonia sp. TCR112 TaxID=2601730 RepID=UPI001C9A3F3A